MKNWIFVILAAVALLAGCDSPKKQEVPIYVWSGIGPNTNMDQLQADFRDWKSKGVVGVCLNNNNPEIVAEAAKRAHAEGLEYHAWIPCMVRGGLPHEWYAVNRLGQKADEFPVYVDYYKALDPRNSEVHEFFRKEMAEIAAIPEVDYVQLDYIRYPDVILARGLWDKYGLVMNEEYAPADYCYCPDCVAAFKEQTGIDILAVEDPSKVAEWAKFRCDAVTDLVNDIADAVHAQGKKLSADVFPGPDSYAVGMVRQQWNEWDVDMFFPMNYNDFYLEGPEWLRTVVDEEVKSVGGKAPVISGLFICREWQRKASIEDPEGHGLIPSEIEEAVRGSLESGATGICLFTPGDMTPEHWEALEKTLK